MVFLFSFFRFLSLAGRVCGYCCCVWTPPEINLKFCLVLERLTAVSLAPGTDVVEYLADPAGGLLCLNLLTFIMSFGSEQREWRECCWR